MSVSSMTNVAFARRRDVEPVGEAMRTTGEIAQATAEAKATQNPVTTALSAIAAYIPTEVLTLYVAVLAATRGGGDESTQGPTTGDWVAVWAFLVGTPVVVWLLYAAKVRTANKPLPLSPSRWPRWEMFAATVAFVAWAVALPQTPFADFSWYSAALAGVIVLVVSGLLGLIAPIVQGTLTP